MLDGSFVLESIGSEMRLCTCAPHCHCSRGREGYRVGKMTLGDGIKRVHRVKIVSWRELGYLQDILGARHLA